MDYGIKVSKASSDVVTATKENLEISSKYPMFKILSQGSTTLALYKTTTTAIITAGQTTIPLTSVTGFHAGNFTSGTTPSAYVADEKFTYTGISGSSLTGCSARASGYASGTAVTSNYNEFSVSHTCSYPPVHFAHSSNDGPGTPNSFARVVPTWYGEFAEWVVDAWVDSSNLYLSVGLGGFLVSTPSFYIQGATHDTYSFNYTIMAESITTPYY
jgi:hypothetical protein